MYVQLAFVLDRIKQLAPQHPEWKTTQPFKGVLDGDMKAVAASGEKGLVQMMAVTHSGMSVEEFQKIVSNWLATAQHPKFKRPGIQNVSTSPCWSCLPICVRMDSKPLSSRVEESSLCVRGLRRSTVSRRNR